MSRFSVSKQDLPDYIQDALFCIESLTPLRFTKAQDWRYQLQGWVLEFKVNDEYEVFANTAKIEFIIKQQFCLNPSIKCTEEDTSDFEEMEYKGNKEFFVYLSN